MHRSFLSPRGWIALLVCLCAASSVQAVTAPEAVLPNAGRYALVIGNNAAGPGQTPLRFAERDARAFASVLEGLGAYPHEQVRVLETPSVVEALAAFDDLARSISTRAARGHQTVFTFYPDATVMLEMDFEDDGRTEYSHPIDGRGWKRLEFQITPPTWFSRVRVRVRKLGEGRAVLGRIRIGHGGGCDADPLPLDERPAGASCAVDGECASGDCAPTRIGLCSATDALVGCDEADSSPCEAVGPDSECVLLDTVSRCL